MINAKKKKKKKLVCTIRLNAKSLKLKIGVYIMRQNSRNLHDYKLMF